MAFSRVFSAQTDVLSGRIVSVEVDTARGLNNFTIVGLGDRAVDEARDRVSSALKNSGFESPKSKNHKTVVSLSPADIKKEGSHYDIAIALGYLLADGFTSEDLSKSIFIGELGLDGKVQPVRGVLPMALAAAREGFTELYVPKENADEAALVEGLAVFPVETLAHVIKHVQKNTPKEWIAPYLGKTSAQKTAKNITDFGDIVGQESAKRGLMIAAAGGHNILMYGPPGTGKTMLSRALAGILPPLSREEALEVTSIYSVTTNGGIKSLHDTPPFRAPHHTSSYVSVIGGGATIKAGEVTLAHRGVLFLDEFPEFDRRVIESLRQPLEEHFVSIARAKGSAVFPAQFLFVASMNPCPCGYKGSKIKSCTCTASDLAKYKRKLSGPLLDRIDMALYIGEIAYDRLAEGGGAPQSKQIREKVVEARARAYERAEKHNLAKKMNGEISAKEIGILAPLTEEAQHILNESAQKLGLSARAHHRTQKLARTIADLAHSDDILPEHILEAIRYRPQTDTIV